MTVTRAMLDAAGAFEADPSDYLIHERSRGLTLAAESNRAYLARTLRAPLAYDLGTDGVLLHASIAPRYSASILDYDDLARRETELARDEWEAWAREDMREVLMVYVARRLLDSPHLHLQSTQVTPRVRRYCTDRASDACANLTPDQLDAIYHSQCARLGIPLVTWEEDYDGQHSCFRVDYAVWGAPFPKHLTPDGWDGMIDGRPIVSVIKQCPRCGAASDADNPTSAWYLECASPTCDFPAAAPHVPPHLAVLALEAITDADSAAVLADACEDRSLADLAARIREPRNRREACKEFLTMSER